MHDTSELIRAIAALAWPIAAIVVVLLFRSEITGLLSGGARRVKAGPFEVEWDRQLSEVETELEQPGIPPADPAALPNPGSVTEELSGVARVSPSAAVMEAYARVEGELRDLLQEVKAPDVLTRTGAAGLARAAQKRGLITDETARAVEGLSVLRNLAAHSHARVGGVSAERALDYLVLVDAVLFALRRRPNP